jgi:hypothetical protein
LIGSIVGGFLVSGPISTPIRSESLADLFQSIPNRFPFPGHSFTASAQHRHRRPRQSLGSELPARDHNGSAANLSDVVTFYDKRFNVGFTDQEKADLIAFLNSLAFRDMRRIP